MNSKNSILELIKEHVVLFDPFKHIYLFGSSIDPNNLHNDIDILIIYAKYSANIEHMLHVFKDELGKASGLLIDITALSIQEEKDVGFLARLKYNYIKIK